MKKLSIILAVSFVALLIWSFAPTNTGGDRLIGVWEPSNGRARVKIEKIGAKYYGKIVWLKQRKSGKR